MIAPDARADRRLGPDARRLEGTPLFALEVLSPTTPHRDVGLKRRAHAEAGLRWFWVVEPAGAEPHACGWRAITLVEHVTVVLTSPTTPRTR